MAGYFISFEGPDGAGKTTQIQLLADFLRKQGKNVMVTHEPGGTRIGNEIRRLLLNPEYKEMVPRAEALLYAASRAQLVAEVIRPALAEGKTVLADRYIDASLAYQGVGRGLGLEEVRRINHFATGGLYPDLTLFFDLAPQFSVLRKRNNQGGDRLEREKDDFHQRVYEGYREIIRQGYGRFIVIDATRSITEVHQQIIETIITLK